MGSKKLKKVAAHATGFAVGGLVGAEIAYRAAGGNWSKVIDKSKYKASNYGLDTSDSDSSSTTKAATAVVSAAAKDVDLSAVAANQQQQRRRSSGIAESYERFSSSRSGKDKLGQ